MKKKIVISSLFIVLIVACIGLIFGIHVHKENNKVFSVITVDVNPSMKISLNKNNKVLSVEALNEDAKIINTKDLKGKEIKKALDVVVEKLHDNGYLKESDNTILINVDSSNQELKDVIKKEVQKITEEKNISSELIIQQIEVTDEIKKISIENNISESKAAYILEQIKDVEEINIGDLVSKNINDVKNIVEQKKEEIQKEAEAKAKEEEKKITENKQQNSSSNTAQQTQQQSGGYGGCNPPAKATENISGWCSFNVKKSQNCNFNYPEQLSLSDFSSMALQQLGVSQWDTIGSYASIKWGDSRSSYCFSGIAIVTTREKRTTFIFDSVKGNVIETKSEAVPTPTITEDQAVQILLDKYGLKREDLKMSNAYFSVDGDGSDNYYYKYDTSITMNDGTQHLVNINPFTGEIIKSFY